MDRDVPTGHWRDFLIDAEDMLAPESPFSSECAFSLSGYDSADSNQDLRDADKHYRRVTIGEDKTIKIAIGNYQLQKKSNNISMMTESCQIESLISTCW